MKVLQRAPRKALILSPVASHPQDFGNRRRVYQTCTFLRGQGYEIHFLLYPMEPDWQARVQDAARAMRGEWDSFQIIPASRPFPLQSPALAEHHTIDEWWDTTIGTHLSWLFAREHFDVFVVNYVFMSKAFEFAGHRTVKVLETHDRFAGRLELLRKLNARIESFYTTESEEKIALDRSDIVIAIKESEAEFYGGLTEREVISVPFWLDQEMRPPLAPETNDEHPLRVGFLGALNVVNVANMRDFLLEFESSPEIAASPIVLDVAGDVCHHLESKNPQVNLLGRVESLEEFYDSLDAVVVPMTLSTGLKIKTGEALAFGKAVVAMSDPFDGFPPVDEFHWLDSFAAVCRALVFLSDNRERLVELETRSRLTAMLARRRMELGYRKLALAISRFQPTIFVVTDHPVFEEGNAEVERLAQWAQLCSGSATTIIGYLGDGVPMAPRPELTEIEIISLGDRTENLDAAITAWNRLERRRRISEVILSVDGNAAPQLLEAATERCAHVTLDTWRPALAAIAAKQTSVPMPDYWAEFDGNGEGILLSMTALRYRPRFLDRWRASRPEGALVILCGPDSSDRAGAELLLARMPGLEGSDVITLAAVRGAPLERDFFERLRAGPRPAVFLAIGDDANALALLDALGNIFSAPCLHFAGARFPSLLAGRDERLFICESYADLAEKAAGLAVLGQSPSVHREDTGWGRYKGALEMRLGKAQNVTLGSSEVSGEATS
ncbi:MAG TPA: glycosyltransferase [Rhizomicrobium sp.]|jgi:glycosyltransferase involved in cell wall biosynthesis|nr:glycosyltransferase [Rhizomicrobium sp.]